VTATVPRAEAEALAAAALRRAGVDPDDAAAAAEILTLAEMMGIATHGLGRVAALIARIRAGGIDPAAAMTVTAPAPALRVVDGRDGLGPAVAARGLRAALAAAAETGVAAAFCTRSSHFGAAAPYCWLAAQAGYACIVLSNTTAMMAPPGGRAARFGNNPVGFGFPNPGGDPLIVDMALSVVSRSRIRAAAQAGAPIPPDWATDADGRPTTDARAAMAGLLAPIGGYKGYALALCVDLLCGLLPSGAFLTQIGDAQADPAARHGVGHAFIAIDARRMAPDASLAGRMAAFADAIHDTPPLDPAHPARLPGERAVAALRRAEAEGLALDPALLDALRAAAA
jgi:LDH2 family malate/lactate/ureidoglycolate dehydrogenase